MIEEAKQGAIQVLLHNAQGPFNGLPRTAGWGYPEPYTRDLLIAAPGILITGDETLIATLRRVLETLARNQSRRGLIPSLVHDPDDRGASDTTPLFLIATALFRNATGEVGFLHEATQRALRWMEYQAPDDLVMVAQQPTSDWRDEHWVVGYGLYVNCLVYAYLRLYGEHEQADALRRLMNRFDVRAEKRHRHVHEGLAVRKKPYYALWVYKIHNNERFDLLGNSLAILFGIASPSRARELTSWIEAECEHLRAAGHLALDLPPCLFPYIQRDHPDWRPRYEQFNCPGEYHNGGVWPFICGFHVAALVAAGRQRLAKQKLLALTRLVQLTDKASAPYGFNEWIKAQDGRARGQDWQTWSAAMYLYAAACVDKGVTPFFDAIRRAIPQATPQVLSETGGGTAMNETTDWESRRNSVGG
ncbi:MAG: hypothetical protein JW993_00345 [Sedimentisphaerales bacterium]|nr:hypothetical protein [Sedimentisphaerales bacterium]